jgi:hypothetical protein
MQRLFGYSLAIGIFLSLTPSALCRAIAPPPLTQRIAVADAIVVGRVTALEDVDIEAAVTPDGPKVKYRIAVVTVNEAIRGADMKTIKVGFVAPVATNGKIGSKYPTVNLQAGRDYVLLLHKHPEGKFLHLPLHVDAIELAPGGKADAEVALVKRCVKLLNNPKAALQSKDEADRLLAAAMLIQKYRSQPTEKTEPIDAEESRLILKVLLDVKDWGNFDPLTRTNAVLLFQRLGLTAQDGWNPPQNIKDYNRDWSVAAQAWLKNNLATYRIQRFVTEK